MTECRELARALWRRSVRPVAVLGASACLAITGCGSADSGTAPKPQIAIALDPGAATVAQGSSVSVTARVTGSNGFSGPATISIVSPGLTASVATPQLIGTTTTSTVTVQAASSTTPGTYTLTIAAGGAGVTGVSASLNVTVTSVAVTGDFSLSAGSSAVAITQGSSSASIITIERTGGFSGDVGLTASGMSNGLTATFNPPDATTGTATLTLSAGAAAATGTVGLTITGVAQGLGTRSATIQVTVSPSAVNTNVSVDFTNCGEGTKPVWFAFQDGTGAWTRVTSAGDVFRFTISSGVGSYAYAARGSVDHSTVNVTMLSRTELTAAPLSICQGATGNKTVGATVKGLGASQDAFVNLGGSNVETSTGGDVSILGVPNGTYDLVAWRFNGPRAINTASDTRPVIIRDVNAAAGQSAGTVDFAASDVIVPTVWGVAFNGGVAGETFSGSMSYYTGPPESCTPALLYNFSNTSPSVPAGTYGFPESAQRATDFHVLNVVATKTPTTRIAQASFHSSGSVTSLQLQAPVTAPTVSLLSATGYKRLQVTGSTPAIYSSTMTFSYSDEVAARSASIQASIAALGGNTATLAFPDFSTVSGWDASWMPAGNSTVNWTFGGTARSYSARPCAEGATFFASYYSGTL